MRIDGAGGCFDNRLYEVDIDVAWNIALLCVNEMGVTIDEQDDAAHQLHFHNKKKIMQLAMQSLDEETVQVIMDSTKERLQNTVPLFCARTAPQKLALWLSSAPSAAAK